ncbi:unnamed protein product, partial [Phaeothamnion confervicola]
AEQQILQLARVQAQRDEEANRLRGEISRLHEQLEAAARETSSRDDGVAKLKQKIAGLEADLARGAELHGVHSTERLQYLKNIVKRAMTCEGRERERLVPVLAAVLHFSDDEAAEVRRAVAAGASGSGTAAGGWASYFLPAATAVTAGPAGAAPPPS